MKPNRYCGPFVLAHVAGISTGEAAAVLRLVTGRKAIKSVHGAELARGLRHLKVEVLQFDSWLHEPTLRRPTLNQWRKNRKGTYIVNITGHFAVLRGTTIWDNQHPEGVHIADYPNRKRMKRVWQVAA
jgi:hypothetical protein